jgi:hypothetical protein
MSGGVGGYDISSDPAVAAAKGLSAKIRAQAQATALAKRKQAAIEYGSAEGLDKPLGKDFAGTQAAAAANPFSILKQQQHSYDLGTHDLEESLNNANLFYSGYRGQQLGEAAHGFQQNKYNAGNAYHGLLSDIGDQLSQALLSADAMDMNAMMGSSGGGYDYGPSGAQNAYSGAAIRPPALPGMYGPSNLNPVRSSAPRPTYYGSSQRRRALSGRAT